MKTIGNYWPYATTLFDYTSRSMPFTEPGTVERISLIHSLEAGLEVRKFGDALAAAGLFSDNHSSRTS